jgi:hypothetical protein
MVAPATIWLSTLLFMNIFEAASGGIQWPGDGQTCRQAGFGSCHESIIRTNER